jgi:hypothetical protein
MGQVLRRHGDGGKGKGLQSFRTSGKGNGRGIMAGRSCPATTPEKVIPFEEEGYSDF